MAQKGTKKTGKNGKGISAADRHDFSYTQNRELSWLQFDNRVLDEAFDTTVPLFERLKFVSIFRKQSGRVLHGARRRPIRPRHAQAPARRQ